jgi:hypothetical protein|tara:strand:+ start:128 stop:307 length:180 start_codon:yes stop_codon:yes gene_type:complete
MAIVANASGTDEKNGGVVTTCLPTGEHVKNDDRAVTTPDIAVINTKYDSRFDDPTYYSA